MMVSATPKSSALIVREQEKVGVLIDGWNFARTCQALDLDVDFEKLREMLVGDGTLVRAVYFLGEFSEEQEPFLRKLRRLGFLVVTKPMKTYEKELADGRVQRVSRCDFSVDFTLHAMLLASRCDRVYLVTGDGDYCPLIGALQDQAVRTVVVSSLERRTWDGKPSLGSLSTDLLEAADQFWELKDMRSELGKSYHGTW